MQSLKTQLPLNLTLTPNRSLSPQGFRLLLGVVALVSGVGATRFILLDAWPVAFFFLVDAALLYGAFKLNYRSGRQVERIQINKDRLLVCRIDAAGREHRFIFNLPWVKLELEEHPAHQSRLWVRACNASIEIGRFLAPFERVEIKEQIEAGLRAAAWQR